LEGQANLEDSEGQASPDEGSEEEASRVHMLFHGKVRESGLDFD
jgi:hypothetical protein